MTSLKSLIYDHLKSHYPNYVNSCDIERLSIDEWGFKASNASRRCRELHRDGLIERQLVKGIATYRYIPRRATDYIPPKEISISVDELPEWREYQELNKQKTLF